MNKCKNSPRKFTDDFKLGDNVAIIRYEHGWFDGSIGGPIIKINDFYCTVECKWGEKHCINYKFDIRKPRDIRIVKRGYK